MNLKSELEITSAAGGMVGEASRAQWAELLERVGGGMVRMAISKVKAKKSARQASVEDVAKELGHKLVTPQGARLAGVQADQIEETRPPSDKRNSPPCTPVTSTVDESEAEAEEVVQPDDEDEDEPTDDADGEQEPLDREQPAAADERNTVSGERRPGARKNLDYLTIARQLVEFSQSELARAAGVSGPSAGKAITRMLESGELKILDSSTRLKRYLFLTGDEQASPALAKKATATVVDGEETAAAAPPAAPLVVEQDLRKQLEERALDPLLTAADIPAVTITIAELAGPLRPLLERVLDAIAHRRGYTWTLRELAACQDLLRTTP